ncbi:MAG TPA: hypothetical protein VEP89_13390 [Draconibacterium sp.]|nr:hypothetical protein [Draconibacterium sp.]
MKFTLIFITATLFIACSTQVDVETEKQAIKTLLEKESQYAASGDLDSWSACWVNTDEASFSMTSSQETQHTNGFSEIKEGIADIEPFDLKMTRDNYQFVIGNDVAYVSYNQKDNWGNADVSKQESRTLKKVDGFWKIVNTTVVDVTSYEHSPSPSFHAKASELPVDPKTGFTNISGIGGVSIGYIDVPAGTDFTPLFAGLPHDMCNGNHWGYMIEGSAEILYANGKTETIEAGEVFYIPAPHTGKSTTGAKFVDFTPDDEFTVLMEQIAENMAAMQNAN